MCKHLLAKSAARLQKGGPDRKQRDYSFDNIRFFLIFLVVFAHCLEPANRFRGIKLVYSTIYSFHMPAFIFLFGYFARFSPRRVLLRWIIPYFIFQTLYLVFIGCLLDSAIKWQYTTPYWLLWYLLACIFYQLMIPVYAIPKHHGRILILFLSVAAALLVGYIKPVGYYLSLSRFFVFQPWFIAGYYCRKTSLLDKRISGKSKHIINAAIIVCLCVSLLCLYKMNFSNKLLYGSYSYHTARCSIEMRLAAMLIALIWLLFIFVTIRPLLNKRIFLITSIGQNTLPIFLLHGFIVKAIPVFCPSLLSAPWLVLLCTVAIVLLTGNSACQSIIKLLCFHWLEPAQN